jgi:hypothetical protein
LDKLENGVAIIGSSEEFCGLVAIPSEELGANLVQWRRGKKKDPSSSYFKEEYTSVFMREMKWNHIIIMLTQRHSEK